MSVFGTDTRGDGLSLLQADDDGTVTLALSDPLLRDLETVVLNPDTRFDTIEEVLEGALEDLVQKNALGECPDCQDAVHNVSTRGPSEGEAFPCGHEMYDAEGQEVSR